MKKVISVFLVLALVFLMSACKKSSDKSTEVIQKEKAAEATTEPTTQAEPEDPLAIYEIEDGNNLCLYRNEKLYSLRGEISNETFENYQMGYKESAYSSGADIYFNPKNTDYEMAFGDFPLIEIQDEDSIRGYGKTKIELFKAEFIGYGITAEKYSRKHFNEEYKEYTQEYVKVYYNFKNHYTTYWFLEEKEAINITDKSGKPVNDYYDLPYNEEYIVSWYEGTEYKEHSLKANNPCYKRSYDSSYSLDGTLTKNGYATFDLSDIPSGLYFIEAEDSIGTFIKIP